MAVLDRSYSKVLSNLEIATRMIVDQLPVSKLLLMRTTLKEEFDGSLKTFLRVSV